MPTDLQADLQALVQQCPTLSEKQKAIVEGMRRGSYPYGYEAAQIVAVLTEENATLRAQLGYALCGHPLAARIANEDREDNGECAWCNETNTLRAQVAALREQLDNLTEVSR